MQTSSKKSDSLPKPRKRAGAARQFIAKEPRLSGNWGCGALDFPKKLVARTFPDSG